MFKSDRKKLMWNSIIHNKFTEIRESQGLFRNPQKWISRWVGPNPTRYFSEIPRHLYKSDIKFLKVSTDQIQGFSKNFTPQLFHTYFTADLGLLTENLQASFKFLSSENNRLFSRIHRKFHNNFSVWHKRDSKKACRT